MSVCLGCTAAVRHGLWLFLWPECAPLLHCSHWRANGGASASYEQDEDHEKKVDNSAKHDGPEPISYGGAAGNRVPTKGPLAEGKNVVSAQRRSQWGLEPKEIKLSRHGAQALNDPVVLLEVRSRRWWGKEVHSRGEKGS